MAICTEEAAFRRAIWNNPDEETLRLVFADFLQERGQAEREAFVRALAGCRWVKVETEGVRERHERWRLLAAGATEKSLGMAGVRNYEAQPLWRWRAGLSGKGSGHAPSLAEARAQAWEYLICWGGTEREPLVSLLPAPGDIEIGATT